MTELLQLNITFACVFGLLFIQFSICIMFLLCVHLDTKQMFVQFYGVFRHHIPQTCVFSSVVKCHKMLMCVWSDLDVRKNYI